MLQFEVRGRTVMEATSDFKNTTLFIHTCHCHFKLGSQHT